jgi:hypothetical protein
VIYNHLAGEHTVGVYPLMEDDSCYFLAVDFDEAEWRDDARAFMQSCDELGVPAALEISRSGKGAHAWVFFAGRVSARDARRLGTAIISHACTRTRQLQLSSYDRLFPNQDTMPKGGFGNLIALPLQKAPREMGFSVFVDADLRPYADQWAFLASIQPMSAFDIEPTILRATGGVHPLDVTFIADEDLATPWKRESSAPKKLAGTMPSSLTVTLANLIYFEKAQLPQALANRLIRLAKQLDDKALGRITKAAAGATLPELAKSLLGALDPDQIVAAAIAAAQAQGINRTEESLTEAELQTARSQRVALACAPFDQPELRETIETARREHEQIIDHVNLDEVIFSGYSAQAEAAAHKVIQTFADYIAAHKDEIAALGFFYQQPYQRRKLIFEMIEELHDALSRPPLLLTTERLWSAYARVRQSQVKGAADSKRQMTDLIALVRFAIGLDNELKPFAETINLRFQEWIFRHNAQRTTAFTPEQTEWLRLMKDHIAASCTIERDDFDYAEFADKGGLQKAWGLFGAELDTVMVEMNEELVA